MTCQLCELIEDGIKHAQAEGDGRKLDVMQRTMEKHLRNSHDPWMIARVSSEAVVWPNGVTWKVKVN